jgi:microcystin-dependent protein
VTVEERVKAASLQLTLGTIVKNISTDLNVPIGDSDKSLATEAAIKNYIDTKFADEVAPIAQEILDKFLVGCIVAFARKKTDEPPEGWLFCDGGSYNAQERPELQNLFEVIGQHYGSGDGSDSGFSVPDLRGIFIRGIDKDGIGRDPDSDGRISLAPDATSTVIGNSLGGYQEDQFQDHDHYFSYTDTITTLLGDNFEWIDAGLGVGNNPITYQNQMTNGIIINPNIRHSSAETRPKNAIFMYCIKY